MSMDGEIQEHSAELLDGPVREPFSAPQMLEVRHLGVYMTYFCVGVIGGAAGSLVYPLLVVLRDEPSNYQSAVGGAFSIFFNLKAFFGVLSDTCPIYGYRRKPYILIGWLLATMATGVLALIISFSPTKQICKDQPGAQGVTVPCGPDPVVGPLEVADFPLNTMVFLMMANNFGYILADVAAESMTVELAKREPLEERGRIQGYCFTVKYFGSILASALTGFALNGPLYGGSFDWELSLPGYMWLLTVLQLVGLPFWLMLHEEPVDPRQVVSFGTRLGQCRDLLKNKAFASMMVFNVLFNSCAGTSVNARSSVMSSWVDMSPLVYSLDSIIQKMALAFVMYSCGRWFKSWHWHSLYIWGTFLFIVPMFLFWLVVYDVVRSPLLVIFIDMDKSFASYLAWLVVSWAAVEMAPPGIEGTTLAIATTVGNAGFNFGGYLSKFYNGLFALSRDDIRLDNSFVRSQYIYNSLLVMVTQCAFFPALPLVPTQKVDAQEKYKRKGHSPIVTGLAICLMTFAIFWDSGSTVAGLFCSCAPILGGNGCSEGHCSNH